MNNLSIATKAVAAASLCLLAAAAQADLQLPSEIGNNMVLQQERDDAVWGWDAPGTSVTVAFRGQTQTAKAGADGKWMTRVPAGAAGGPFPLTITGTTTVILSNVLVGEVWIAGGQSNMWWHVGVSANAKEEIAAANYPDIRYWDADTSPNQGGWPADTPQRTVQAEWKVTSPQVVGDFCGVPYFFARDLYLQKHIPIGILNVSVPGTEIELHLSPAYLQQNLPQAAELYALHKQNYPALKQQYDTAHAAWEQNKTGTEPKAPDVPGYAPGALFNGMIAPTAPYTTRGFLWWQGEYNASRSLQYSVLFPGLIDEWRQLWGDNTLPFLYVELANFGPPQTVPVEEAPWPSLRDAQRTALQLPGTYEVSAIDVKTQAEGDWAIHPIHKQIVGHRLFLAAMANIYGDQTMEWSGPVYKSVVFKGNKAIVTFYHLTSLYLNKAALGPLKGFALAGADRQFHWAEATHNGNQVILTNKEVPNPIAVRYAWGNNPIGSLYNQYIGDNGVSALPAFPFRTDHWNLKQ